VGSTVKYVYASVSFKVDFPIFEDAFMESSLFDYFYFSIPLFISANLNQYNTRLCLDKGDREGNKAGKSANNTVFGFSCMNF